MKKWKYTNVYDQCVLPVITYGTETRSLTMGLIRKLKVTQRALERAMLGVSLCDSIRNENIRRRTKFLLLCILELSSFATARRIHYDRSPKIGLYRFVVAKIVKNFLEDIALQPKGLRERNSSNPVAGKDLGKKITDPDNSWEKQLFTPPYFKLNSKYLNKIYLL